MSPCKPSPEHPPRAILSTRVSTFGQAEKVTSRDQQLRPPRFTASSPRQEIAAAGPKKERSQAGETHMPMYEFEEFQRGTGPTTEPALTIMKRGVALLNKSAYLALGQPEAVKLLFDRKRRVIGLRPVQPDERNAYRIRKKGDSATYQVGMTAFLASHGIDATISRRWKAQMVEGVLAVDTREPATEVIRPRREKTPAA